MNANLAQLARTREQLLADLSRVRRISVRTSAVGDVRTLASLTLEAARINQALSDVECAELELR